MKTAMEQLIQRNKRYYETHLIPNTHIKNAPDKISIFMNNAYTYVNDSIHAIGYKQCIRKAVSNTDYGCWHLSKKQELFYYESTVKAIRGLVTVTREPLFINEGADAILEYERIVAKAGGINYQVTFCNVNNSTNVYIYKQ